MDLSPKAMMEFFMDNCIQQLAPTNERWSANTSVAWPSGHFEPSLPANVQSS
jgi:hypothetical protein